MLDSYLGLSQLWAPFSSSCGASQVAIGAVLTQARHPLAYFSENLNGSRLNYSIYDKESVVWLDLWNIEVIVSS